MNCTFPELETLASSSCNLTKLPFLLNYLKKARRIGSRPKQDRLSDTKMVLGLGKGTLQYLDISSNLVKGGIHEFPWKEFITVDLNDNVPGGRFQFYHSLCSSFGPPKNCFSREIPFSICILGSLDTLHLARNNLSGSIPNAWEIWQTSLNLDLSATKFEWTLLQSLDNCAWLFDLNVGYNKIKDSFPKWLPEAPSLRSINRQFDGFHGQIYPPIVQFLPSTLYNFSISNNKGSMARRTFSPLGWICECWSIQQ